MSTWQPVHAEVNGWIGLIGPCGSTTCIEPVSGRSFCSLPLTWHIEQFLVSVAAPVGLSAGNRYSAEVVVASAEADHDIRPVGRLHIDAVVDAVHQQVEVDALRRRGLIRSDWSRLRGSRHPCSTDCGTSHSIPCCCERAVKRQRDVALIAVAQRDHRAPRRHRRAVHREIRHLIRRAVLNRVCTVAPPTSSGTVSCACASTPIAYVPVALAGTACVNVYVQFPLASQVAFAGAFGHIARRGDVASEAGVAVIGGRPGHGERDRAKRRQRNRVPVLVQHRETRPPARSPPFRSRPP